MRLLIDCTPLWAGGGVQVAVAFLENIQHASSITWMAAVPEQLLSSLPTQIAHDARIIRVQKGSHIDRARLHLQMRRLESRLTPDVVFTVFGPPYFTARAPHVVGFALPRMIYTFPANRAIRLAERGLNLLRGIMLRRIDHVVVETATVKERLSRIVRVPRSRISVIANCVNPLLARIPSEPVQAGGAVGILTPSAYYPHKNLDIIPHVAAALKVAANFDFEFRLTLPLNSDAWTRIAAQADLLGVREHVTTLGSLDLASLANAYQKARVVFLPTLLEASTAVYPEAFHFRRALVTSDLDFARELCKDAAIFVDPESATESADAIIRLAQDTQLYDHQVQAGVRQLSVQYPTPEEKFQRQIELLQRIASRASP